MWPVRRLCQARVMPQPAQEIPVQYLMGQPLFKRLKNPYIVIIVIMAIIGFDIFFMSDNSLIFSKCTFSAAHCKKLLCQTLSSAWYNSFCFLYSCFTMQGNFACCFNSSAF